MSIASATVTGIGNKTYTGKAQTQSPIVKVGGKTLKSGTDYTLTYKNNVKAGKATVTMAGKGAYTGSASKTFTIVKAPNPITVKGKTSAVKYAKVKKKAQVLKVGKVLAIAKAQGAKTYAKKSGNKKIVINKKTGKMTVKKGLKKGTYKVKVAVKAAGNANYKAKTVVKVFKVKVKWRTDRTKGDTPLWFGFGAGFRKLPTMGFARKKPQVTDSRSLHGR